MAGAASITSCMRCRISTPRRDIYARAGFTVGARNRHPPAWGKQNHIVQLPGCFVELLAMADTSAIVAARRTALFVRRFQPRFPGARAGAFDARARRTRQRCGGRKPSARPASAISTCSILRATPGGRTVRRPRSPSRWPLRAMPPRPISASSPAGSTFRKISGIRRFRSHANGVTGIAGIVLVADRPQRSPGVSRSLHWHRRHGDRCPVSSRRLHVAIST